jgi:hypothetical protein
MFVAEHTILLNADSGSTRRDGAAMPDWDSLAEPLQLTLASAALRRAAASIAFQAETLAQEMEMGSLEDRGGADSLRLLATLIRVTTAGDPI